MSPIAHRAPQSLEATRTGEVPPAADEIGSGSAPTFEGLGVADVLGEVGIERPFPIQALTLPDALAGRDVCGEAQTGSGKRSRLACR